MYTVDLIWKTQGGCLLQIHHIKLMIWKARNRGVQLKIFYIIYGVYNAEIYHVL